MRVNADHVQGALKGKGSRALLDSYRPITLLNNDCRLWLPVFACPSACGGPHSDRFCAWSVDWRQCVVALQEVEYLQQTGQPGCMVFWDFSKAYDRLSRP